ncbi:MAG: PAS domain S-box protein [Deltaproteobacteria bacterium]|nr:PAS domain S-box protein [Deltaproteobacteria bacterium]
MSIQKHDSFGILTLFDNCGSLSAGLFCSGGRQFFIHGLTIAFGPSARSTTAFLNAALQRSREDLEERVEERTKALEKANREMDKALQERLKAEERFRNIAEMSPNMIFINWWGHVVYANEQSTKIMGYTREEFYSPQFDFISLIASESVSRARKNLERHMKREEMAPYEVTLVTRHGRRLETIVSTRLIDLEGEKAILGIITDISHQKRTEERIRESETRFRAMAQSAKDAIITVNHNGKITFFNRSAQEIFGYERQEILGREVTLLIPDRSKNAHLQGMARVREKGALIEPGRIIETAGVRRCGGHGL